MWKILIISKSKPPENSKSKTTSDYEIKNPDVDMELLPNLGDVLPLLAICDNIFIIA